MRETSEVAVDTDDARRPRFGQRLRRARLQSGLRLKDVAAEARCSESMLSRIENDRAAPSLSSLHRLCKALSINISTLLEEKQEAPWAVLRPGQRQVIGYKPGPDGECTIAEVLVPYESGRRLEGSLMVMEPGGHSGGPLQHHGEEVGYVIEGELELVIDGRMFRLGPGDSFYFPSDLPHAYSNPGQTVMRAIWINTPPTF